MIGVKLLTRDAYGNVARTWATLVRRTSRTLVVDVTGVQLRFRRARGGWEGVTSNARRYAVQTIEATP